MYSIFENGKICAWVDGVAFDDTAKEQLIKLTKMPFLFGHVAVMPDVHAGKGSTIGSVIATTGAIIPAAVGVDIGCGMIASKTNLKAKDLPDNLYDLRVEIESRVPHGRTNNGGENDKGANSAYNADFNYLFTDKKIVDLVNFSNDKHLVKSFYGCWRHMGTLGTGNHFIEICLDESQDVWVMIHSGSRGIGNSMGRHFITKAKQDMKKWWINLPDEDLAYIPEGSETFDDYITAVNFAQNFAKLNRLEMLKRTILAMSFVLKRDLEYDIKAVDCHHNYISKEFHFGNNVWITRKGAVRARNDDLGIIPGSMGEKSYIVRGKGNDLSFHSCSHGAGRVMSRTKAKEAFTIDDHIKSTSGVECKKDESVLDETPQAYKNIDAVMEAQKDLVEIVHTLKQIVCVKG